MRNKVAWKDREVSMGIFRAKYAKDENETPEEFCYRVASIVRPSIRDFIYNYLADGTFCFGGRTLYMAGRKDEVKASSSNCYIMPMPKDSIEDIYKSNAEMARIFTRGGGAGVNISNLRPVGAKVHNAAETSTGAVSFLNLYNTTGDIIGARGRRAAEMVVLNCDHPDVIELVHAKERHEALGSMNISVLFSNDFMEAVKRHRPYTLYFHCDDTDETITREIDANAFFREFCQVAWDMGDPGVLFNDMIQEHNFNPWRKEYRITASNPCSEFLGPDYSSCNLGSLNIYNFVHDKFAPYAYFDWSDFCYAVQSAVIALNDVLDYGYDNQPLEANKKCIDDWRQIGLGIFGLADACVALRIKYGSPECIQFVNDLFHVMHNAAVEATVFEAVHRGAYDKWDWNSTKDSPCLKPDDPIEQIEKYGMRNASLLSIAPTGSMSLFMGNFTGGIEPIFKLYYDRSTHKMEKTGESFRVYSRSIEDLLKFHNLPLDMTVEEIKEKFPWVVEAHDVDWSDRVLLQATAQRYVDNAISSTVNLPHDATPQDVYDIYMSAWATGCKGITVFRDGCARGNILGVNETRYREDKSQEVKAEVKTAPKYGADADFRVCPECGEKLFKVEGHCGYCMGCGFSACSRN